MSTPNGYTKPMMLDEDDAVHVGGGDGRPTVTQLLGDFDPLLERLKKVHGAPRYDHFMNPQQHPLVAENPRVRMSVIDHAIAFTDEATGQNCLSIGYVETKAEVKHAGDVEVKTSTPDITKEGDG
jgi:hypothetical protein